MPSSITWSIHLSRLDALWLLVRYRAALERDVDFTDVSEAALLSGSDSSIRGKIGSDGSSDGGVGGVNAAVRLEAALRATAAAQDACAGGEGGKEPVHSLDALQGNEVTRTSIFHSLSSIALHIVTTPLLCQLCLACHLSQWFRLKDGECSTLLAERCFSFCVHFWGSRCHVSFVKRCHQSCCPLKS